MNGPSLAEQLAQAVCDAVTKRDGVPPSIHTCLRKMYEELARWDNVPMEQRSETWKAVVIERVTKAVQPRSPKP